MPLYRKTKYAAKEVGRGLGNIQEKYKITKDKKSKGSFFKKDEKMSKFVFGI